MGAINGVQSPDEQSPPSIPDHELLRRIGKGSYGTVWLARNALGAWRAIKVVHRNSFDSDRPFEREFEGIRKFEPVSRHLPSQLDILHVGRRDDFFFYIMELADPVPASPDTALHSTREIDPATYEPLTLKARLRSQKRLPFPECLRIARSLIEAVEHLHQAGLVHRDIKPSNIIFVNDVPRLADIGLVTDSDATRTFVGTEGFIPPEGAGTPAADLYALGKVLYEISTGLDRNDFPAVAPDFGQNVERHSVLELLEVIMKACAPNPADRYASATEMRADLEALSAGLSVRHRQWWSALRRRTWRAAPLAVATAGLVAVVLWAKRPQQKLEALSRNPEALRSYQLGVFHGQKRTDAGYSNAVFELQRAIALDPGFPAAHAALAEVAVTQARFSMAPPAPYWQLARTSAENAFELDPNNYQARLALATYQRDFARDLTRAENLCGEALKTRPADANAYYVLSGVLAYQGRMDEAIAAARQAAERDPVSSLLAANVASRLVLARRFAEAETQYRHAVALQPNFHVPYDELGFLLMFLKRDSEAHQVLQKLWQLSGRTQKGIEMDEAAWRQGGPRAYLESLFDAQLQARAAGQPFNPDAMSKYLVWLSRLDEAMVFAEMALQERRSMFYLIVHPFYDALREHPKYPDLVRRIRTPENLP